VERAPQIARAGRGGHSATQGIGKLVGEAGELLGEHPHGPDRAPHHRGLEIAGADPATHRLLGGDGLRGGSRHEEDQNDVEGARQRGAGELVAARRVLRQRAVVQVDDDRGARRRIPRGQSRGARQAHRRIIGSNSLVDVVAERPMGRLDQQHLEKARVTAPVRLAKCVGEDGVRRPAGEALHQQPVRARIGG
jgi:hypothetical protein